MPLVDKFAIVNGQEYVTYDLDKFTTILRVDQQNAIISRNEISGMVGMEVDTMILPAKKIGTDMSEPGVYFNDDPLFFVTFPAESDQKKYIPKPENTFDLSNIENIQDYVTEKEAYDNSITALLETDPEDDTIFTPPLLKTDSPEMKALKKSVMLKRIDLDKYAPRFGSNYPNDKRKFKDDNITSFMLKRICQNLDMEVDLVFRDAPGNIANPMGKVVRVNMIPGIDSDAQVEERMDY